MSTVAAIRHRTGLSQSAFAKRFGISLRTLQQWEQRRSNPPAYVIPMINRILALEEKQRTPESKQEITLHKLPAHSTWKVCIDRPFANCERVYPIQQRKVRAVLDRIEGNENVEKAVVFGSSVTPACHVGSDLDIYLELHAEANITLSDLDFEVDYWNNHTVDERLKKEIERKGVLVYGR